MSPVPVQETAKEAHDRVIRRATEATRASAAILDRIAHDLEQSARPPVYKGTDLPLLREVRTHRIRV